MNIYGNLPEDIKKQIIHQRRSRGFPLHEPPHWQNASGEFHITASCYKHQKIFEKPDSLEFLSSTYLKALSDNRINVIAWVFLPNHYHLLVELSQLRDLSEIIRIVHSKTATEMNKFHKKKGRKVWFRYADRKIRSERHHWATINYIHINPVKHKYVASVYDWKWSSLFDYLEIMSPEDLNRIWQLYPVDNYGNNWDW